MEIHRLGVYDNVSPLYLPDAVIEGFSSKVWTERFVEPGDFQFKTYLIDETMALLPEGTFITHKDTREVAQVETHLITNDSNGNPQLTITGRTVDSILESRFVEGSYQKKRQMVLNYTALEASLVLLWNAIANQTGWDVTRRRKDADPDDDKFHDGDRWTWTTKDALPNVIITSAVYPDPTEDNHRWWLKEGMLLEQLRNIMKKDDLGIRIIRPPSGLDTTEYLVEVDAVPPGFGELVLGSELDSSNSGKLRFEFFQGTDRTVNQSVNSPVIFDALNNDFTNSSDLWSIKEWRTGVEIVSELNRQKDIYRSGESGNTGWERRMTMIDAGSPELPPKPDYPGKNASETQQNKYETRLANWQAKRNVEYDAFEEDYTREANRLLKNTRKIRLFSGDISPESRWKYKEDYFLGDTVTLRGLRGLSSKARVTEFIRTDDAEGDRGYPTLDIL